VSPCQANGPMRRTTPISTPTRLLVAPLVGRAAPRRVA